MVKKVWVFVLVVLMVLTPVSCSGGSYSITIGKIDSSGNQLNGKYNSFSGYYFKEVKLTKGETMSVTFSATTEKGKITARVIDSNGKTIKTLNTGDTVSLNQPGKYKLQVEGKKHKGEFTLSWNIN